MITNKGQLSCHNLAYQPGIFKIKIAKISMQKTLVLTYKKPIFSNKKTKYTAKIGSILYVIVKTEMDITFKTIIMS